MSDVELREAERRWRESPDDRAAYEAAVSAYRRAGRDLPFDLLVRSDRWKRHAGFVAKWCCRPLAPGEGHSIKRIDAAERRLGISLPQALREWYVLARALRQDFRDHILWPQELTLTRAGLVIAHGIRGWRVRDLKADDPPVFVQRSSGRNRWLREYPSLSTALLTALVALAAHGHLEGEYENGIAGLSNRSIAGLKRAYSPLPLPVSSWMYGREEFLGDADTVVMLNKSSTHPNVRIATRTPQALARAQALMWELAGIPLLLRVREPYSY